MPATETGQFDRRYRPNFFILGAPKCGTTSIAMWLAQHPKIYMSPIKEPNFFNTDDRLGVSTLFEYENLFRDVTDDCVAVGEASVWYLSSPVAVANILRYQPQARFVVMLRNPVEMAPALHAEMLFSGHESVRSFREAWDLQKERSLGRRLPSFSWVHRCFLYGELCGLGTQLERLFAVVPRDRVLTTLLDDLIEDPRREYLRILRFLKVDDDGRCEFPVYNSAKVLRWPRLGRLMFIAYQMKGRIGIDLNLGLCGRISGLNVAEGRAPLPHEAVEMLRDYFAGDVASLGHLLGRNLQHWLGPATSWPERRKRSWAAPRERSLIREPIPV